MAFTDPSPRKSRIARYTLRILGWKLLELESYPKRSVVIAYPHAGAVDLFYTLLLALALGLRVKIVAKEELFLPIIGLLLRDLDCIPVKRGSMSGTTDKLAEMICTSNHNNHLVMAITGTRKKGASWKTGPLVVAHVAQVSLLLATVNREKKECGIFQEIPPGKTPHSIELIKSYYKEN